MKVILSTSRGVFVSQGQLELKKSIFNGHLTDIIL